MRSMFKSVLVALIAVFALGALTASSALAHEWYELPPKGPESAITESKAVTSSGTIELEDQRATGGAVSFKCSLSSKGTVEPAGNGSVTEMKLTKCRFAKHGQCKARGGEEELTELIPTATAVHLPWKTLLKESAGELTNQPLSGTGGEPGFKWECETIFGKQSDECVGTTLVAKVYDFNETKGGGVTEELVPWRPEPRMKCKQGGSESGFATTKIIMKFSTGEPILRVK